MILKFKGGPGSGRRPTGGGNSGRGQNSSINRGKPNQPNRTPGHAPVIYINRPSTTEPGKPQAIPTPAPRYSERPASTAPGRPRSGVSPVDLYPERANKPSGNDIRKPNAKPRKP